ncbi:hypothetical protein DHD05_22200 [Arenibacter sp. N53]|uniref:hypothetical protein n=1 Tax=Arenibacter TaxID=178469 RepID=UPI000CD49836|nr:MULTISPECIES: hypothetical protein [Arenibacter]MCM4154307.1 hypothetical protein [Arenibacter sp. N53]
MTEQAFTILALIIAALGALLTFIRAMTVNSSSPAPTKPWDLNKKTMTIILGLLAGLSIATGLKVLVLSIDALLNKKELSSLDLTHMNELFTQLIDATGYFALGGIIFIILGIKGFAVLWRKD